MSTWIIRDAQPGTGLRVAVKDLIDMAGFPTTAGSRAVAVTAAPAERDAACLAGLRAAIGAGRARFAGKTNLHELAYGVTGVNGAFGTPVNPLDPRRVPGGSSSGSAAAVAAGEADIAYGSDTGGSIRIPAACCGIAGLKTTWGRVPLDGVYPLAPSLDTVGPLGADVAAIELGMGLIEPGFAAGSCELIVGRMRPEVDVDPMTDAAVDAALVAAGVRVTEVEGFGFRAAVGATNVLIDAEAYQANAYLIPYLDRLTPQLRRNLTESAAITADQVEAAQRVRREASDWLTAALDQFPVLALPTLVGAPPLLGERGMPLTVLTMPANLAGLPALALPVPGGPAGLSASLQLIGPPGGEERLIALGRLIEAAVR